MSAQLEQIYHAYLDTLNERRLGDLGQYLQDHVVYNGKTITRQQYAQMIADDVHNIPDLRFVIDLCVFSDDTDLDYLRDLLAYWQHTFDR